MRFFQVFLILFFSFGEIYSQLIYTVDTRDNADVVVFMTDHESKCDLKVFFVEEASQLGKPGVWAGTFELDKAQKKVYFTFEESEAQIKIFVVDEESKAGWVTEDKKKLLE